MDLIDVGTLGTVSFLFKDVMPDIYKDLAQPTVRKVGKALEVLADYGVSNITYWGEKRKVLLQKRLLDYANSLEAIPEEKILPVLPDIGIPLIQKLSYVTSDEVAKLFIKLLSNASSVDTVNLVLPRYLDIVESLSPDEAKIINYFKGKDTIPYFIVKNEHDGISKDLTAKITGIEFKIELDFKEYIYEYIDNLVGLRILSDKEGRVLADTNAYQELEGLFGSQEYFEAKMKNIPNPPGGGRDFWLNAYKNRPGFEDMHINFIRSYYQITVFGKSFVKCCTNDEIQSRSG